ncbi:MAG: hypothetical protein K0U84_01765 [Actinomycetia bacterium]|nr:hypothetical protein [Actinomycetes bacterium]
MSEEPPMEEVRERIQGYLRELKRHRQECRVESPEERARRQQARAEQVAHDVTGGRVTRGIVKAMLALVVADEHPEPEGEKSSGVSPGARQVLKLKPKPVQEALW